MTKVAGVYIGRRVLTVASKSEKQAELRYRMELQDYMTNCGEALLGMLRRGIERI